MILSTTPSEQKNNHFNLSYKFFGANFFHHQYHLRYSPEARIFRFQPIVRLKHRKDPGSIPGTGSIISFCIRDLTFGIAGEVELLRFVVSSGRLRQSQLPRRKLSPWTYVTDLTSVSHVLSCETQLSNKGL